MYEYTVKRADQLNLERILQEKMIEVFSRDKEVYGKDPCTKEELKEFFQDPRPDPILNIDPWLEHSTSFGFPSGHTQIAVVIWLYIAMNVKNSIAKIISIIFLFGIPLSRLYLGVHDVGDILGGIFFGILTLLAFSFLFKKLKSKEFKLNLIIQFIIF